MIKLQTSALNQNQINCEEDGNVLLRKTDVYRSSRNYGVKFQSTVCSVSVMSFGVLQRIITIFQLPLFWHYLICQLLNTAAHLSVCLACCLESHHALWYMLTFCEIAEAKPGKSGVLMHFRQHRKIKIKYL